MRMSYGSLTAALASAVSLAALAAPATAAEITFWHHTYPPADELIQEKAAEYMAEHPDVTIRFQDEPHGDYEVKLLASIAAGNPPDIVNLLDYLFPQYATRGILAPLDPEAFGQESMDAVREMYMPAALSGLTIDGTTYGVPEEFNTLALFINGDHMRDIGLDPDDPANYPETWDDLFTLAEKLQVVEDDGTVSRLGFNWVWNLDPYWYAQQYWPILQQYDCDVIGEDGKAAINSEACVQAFSDTWLHLIDSGLGGPHLATVNPVNALEDFSTGRQSMAIAGIWAPPLYSEEVQDAYVVAPLPQRDPANPETLLNSYALAVSAESEYPEVAWDFLRYLVSDSDAYLERAGYVTGIRGWADSEVAQRTKGSQVFAEGQKHGSFVWRSPTWTEEGSAIKSAIEQFAQGVPVQDALDQAAAQIDVIRSR
ncbi:MAG: sugar ABC transporter substrate-binding protein [Azospirillaceae bacterium]